VVATVLISEESDQLSVGEERDCFRSVDGIEVRDERNRNPIMSGNAPDSSSLHGRKITGDSEQTLLRYTATWPVPAKAPS
jgi:hypothetical protein